MARATVKATPSRPRKAAPANRGHGKPGVAKYDPDKHPRGPDGRFLSKGGKAPKPPKTPKAAAKPKPPRKVGTAKQRKGLADQIRAARTGARTPEARKALLQQVRDLRQKRAEWKRGQGKTQVERLPKPPKEPRPKTPRATKEKAPKKEPKKPKESKKATAPARPAGTHGTLDEATGWASAHGVEVVKGSPVTLEQLNRVNTEVAKMPAAALETIRKAGGRMDVLSGRGITDHPDMAWARGVTPRGWTPGKTWDDVPGGAVEGSRTTVIVANRLTEGHGSNNLVLHEHAHTYDHSLGHLTGTKGSDSPAWREIHGKVQWPSSYQAGYPEEGYAESFSRYFGGPTARSMLPSEVQAYWKGAFPA